MQQIKVRYEKGVFVPIEGMGFKLHDGATATVELGYQKEGLDQKAYQDMAKTHFKQLFPDVEVDQGLLNLVGILREVQIGSYKEEYQGYLRTKYDN